MRLKTITTVQYARYIECQQALRKKWLLSLI
jgi:hypothetical protein